MPDNAPAPAATLNGYISFYKGRTLEVYAATRADASAKACAFFKPRKSYEVTSELAEVNGVAYVHTAT